jgi:uncharacterized protein (TIGR00297 family)
MSKVKETEKLKATLDFEKGSTKRDAVQVVANGLIPLFFALAYGLFELFPNLSASNSIYYNPYSPYFIAVFVAFAVHTADTWATEIGILSKSNPRLVTNLHKKVLPGTSGGITFIGSAASLLGSILIAIIYLVVSVVPTFVITGNLFVTFVLIIIGGFMGSILDSIEGATIQGIYFCDNCGKETEANPHKRCGNETRLSRGIQLINNDLVNLSSTIIVTCVIMLIISQF